MCSFFVEIQKYYSKNKGLVNAVLVFVKGMLNMNTKSFFKPGTYSFHLINGILFLQEGKNRCQAASSPDRRDKNKWPPLWFYKC